MQKITYLLLVFTLIVGCNSAQKESNEASQNTVVNTPSTAISTDQINDAKSYVETASKALEEADQLNQYNLISSLSRLAGS
ncbi:MAG: hypothetical protein NXI20_27700, partial [bacterium]|nr:hypothetical protein [bacterium]